MTLHRGASWFKGRAAVAGLAVAVCCVAPLRPVSALAAGGDAPTAAAPGSAAAPWWRSAVFYEVFVRSFQDSNGDGVGDLDGVTNRLEYLSGLGIGGLWLMPTFPSPSYHGYDVMDYKGVNQDYGTGAALTRLVDAAHARGIRVILDIPLNHTSSKHPWFQAGLADARAPERRRYVWRDHVPDWSAVANNAAHWHQVADQYYFSYFSKNMPDLNWDDADVYTDVAAALTYWVGLGVDGFRLDAARYLVEGPLGEPDTLATHQLWQRLVRDVKAVAPQTLFVGEVWADQRTINGYYGAGDELDQCFGFPLAGGLVSAVRGGDPAGFLASLKGAVGASAPAFFSAPFLTNHDQERLATTLGGDTAKLKLAAAALLTLPGTPYLYYGEEIGLPNGTAAAHKGDLAKRTPMLWDQTAGRGFTSAAAPWLAFAADAASGIDVATQAADPESLLETYRQLLALRRQESALAMGTTTVLGSPAPHVAAYTRSDGHETLVVVLNFGSATTAVRLTAAWAGPATASAVYGGGALQVSTDGAYATVVIPQVAAHGAMVVRLTAGNALAKD